jgi:dTMP kinase
MGQGFLLALEGIDGSGKTTQARLLRAALEARGFRVVLTQEPSTGPWGRKLRLYLQGPSRHLSPAAELELFLADRREHVREVIQPALAAGHVVISDRYYHSSVAYQGALGLDAAAILAQNEAFAPRPDLVFVLTLPVAAARARLKQARRQGLQVSEEAAYLEQVAAIYAGLQGAQIRHLDATAAAEALHGVILQETLAALSQKAEEV